MSNTLDLSQLKEGDFRKSQPRYQSEYAENNTNLAKAFAEIAHKKGCSSAQLALAWVLAQGENIIPIPGTKRTTYLIENAGAVDIELNQTEIAEIEQLLITYPNIGDRYNENNKKLVDRN